MKAIEFTEPGRINIIDIPNAPDPEPGEALVRTHCMGICGTDLSCYLGKFPFFAYPRIPGHELGLEVVAVGDGVINVQIGDRCSLEPYINDPTSVSSRKGATNCCPGVQVIGVHNNGGLRQGTFIVPAIKLHPGNDLDYEQLALVETLAIGYHAVQRGNPGKGETVLVIGAGPIGLACLEFLKSRQGVNVIVMDLFQSRLDFCTARLGIEKTIQFSLDGSHLAKLAAMTGGELADVVLDATGNAESMSRCFEFAAFTGRVVYVGITTSEVSFPHAPVFHRRELTLLASRNAVSQDFDEIIDLIRKGQINTNSWITHRIAFAEVPNKFADFTDPNLGAIKAVIQIQP